MNNLPQRDAFWNKVYENPKHDKDIIVISADMGAPALDKFRVDLPAQFVNVGIAEQNAITLASGLAMNGKKVFTYAIAPFITLRCLEQIRVENAIMNIPITIVGVGGGFGYEDSGPTHHLVEDLAIMRSMPNIVINSITDSIMADYFADLSCREKTWTNYVRLERATLPMVYDKKSDFSKGLSVLKTGDKCSIIATGSMVQVALDAADKLAKKKIKVGVIDLFSLPINEKHLLSAVKGVKKIVTLEEHFLPGGLGSAVCEVLCDNSVSVPVKRIGISTEQGYCYKYGGREVIREHLQIDSGSVQKKVEKFIKA